MGSLGGPPCGDVIARNDLVLDREVQVGKSAEEASNHLRESIHAEGWLWTPMWMMQSAANTLSATEVSPRFKLSIHNLGAIISMCPLGNRLGRACEQPDRLCHGRASGSKLTPDRSRRSRKSRMILSVVLRRGA